MNLFAVILLGCTTQPRPDDGQITSQEITLFQQPLEFNQQRPQMVTLLERGPGKPDLLVLSQYASCNGSLYGVLALSSDGNRLVPYAFVSGQQKKFYNNATQSTEEIIWRIDDERHELIQIM
jgi:hypothetical protein